MIPRTMPGMIYDGKGARDWTPRFPRDTDSDNISWYMLPPVKYPDGKLVTVCLSDVCRCIRSSVMIYCKRKSF